MADDTVLAQPVRSYLEGDDLKHPDSPPYRVSVTRFRDLQRNSLVIEAEPATETLSDAEQTEAAAEAEPTRRGRQRPA